MFKRLYFLYIISHTHCNSSTFRWLSFRLKSHSCSVSKSHYLQGYCKRGLDRVQQTMVCVPLSNCCLNCICGPYAVLNCFSCVWLCNPMDCSPPGSPVHGILQARILEWVAISFLRGSFWPRDQTHVSYVYCAGRRVPYHWHHLGSPWAENKFWIVEWLEKIKSKIIFHDLWKLCEIQIWMFMKFFYCDIPHINLCISASGFSLQCHWEVARERAVLPEKPKIFMV